MIHIGTLEHEDGATLYAVFMEAFSDYAVPVSWARAEFEAANLRRGFDPSLSLGAYDGERLVGFILSGQGRWKGEVAAYDMGTGVVPAARGSGLAGRLAEELKRLLRERGIPRYVLEVLRSNEPAIKTYRRAGFSVTRLFECPGGEFQEPGIASPEGLEIRELRDFPRAEAVSFRDWEPSWQNSDAAIARSVEPPLLLGALEEERLRGYLVAGTNGTIWQLAVHPDSRRQGIGTALLRDLSLRVGGKLRYVNVQSDDAATLSLLARAGIVEGPGQYEMEFGALP